MSLATSTEASPRYSISRVGGDYTAYDINDHGQVLVFTPYAGGSASRTPGFALAHGYGPDAGTVGPDLHAGSIGLSSGRVNNSGQVASSLTSYRWDGNQSVVDHTRATVSTGNATGVDLSGGPDRYGRIELGTLGGTNSSAAAINDQGQVVGSADTAAGSPHAFRVDPDGTINDLGVLPGGKFSEALAINREGTAVGVSDAGTGTDPNLRSSPGLLVPGGRAVVFEGNESSDPSAVAGTSELATPVTNGLASGPGPLGGTPGTATGSAGGQAPDSSPVAGTSSIGTGTNGSQASDPTAVAGTSSTTTATSTSTAHDSGTVARTSTATTGTGGNQAPDPGTAGGTSNSATATGIGPARSQILLGRSPSTATATTDGQSRDASAAAGTSASTAATTGIQVRDLGTLGGTSSIATGINDAGTIIGTAETLDGTPHAVIWLGNQMIDLGTVAVPRDSAAAGYSRAVDINDAGQVVGESNGRAFLYEEGAMLDLNDLLPDDAGVVLRDVAGINNLGQIVAYGAPVSDQLARESYVLTPAGQPIPQYVPEPTPLHLLLLAGAGMAWRRAKRSPRQARRASRGIAHN